jgi:hypothetical protein
MKLINYILKHGTVKMFKLFLERNNIDINQNLDIINAIFQDNINLNMGVISYLINESNMKYSYRITKEINDRMSFNFKVVNNEFVVKINSDVMADYDIRLDRMMTGSNYFHVIFQKYKKCFLVFSKSLNPPKLGKKDIHNILRYF